MLPFISFQCLRKVWTNAGFHLLKENLHRIKAKNCQRQFQICIKLPFFRCFKHTSIDLLLMLFFFSFFWTGGHLPLVNYFCLMLLDSFVFLSG
jgi:hypothetical protein